MKQAGVYFCARRTHAFLNVVGLHALDRCSEAAFALTRCDSPESGAAGQALQKRFSVDDLLSVLQPMALAAAARRLQDREATSKRQRREAEAERRRSQDASKDTACEKGAAACGGDNLRVIAEQLLEAFEEVCERHDVVSLHFDSGCAHLMGCECRTNEAPTRVSRAEDQRKIQMRGTVHREATRVSDSPCELRSQKRHLTINSDCHCVVFFLTERRRV